MLKKIFILLFIFCGITENGFTRDVVIREKGSRAEPRSRLSLEMLKLLVNSPPSVVQRWNSHNMLTNNLHY